MNTTVSVDVRDVERSFDAMERRGKQLGQAFRVIKGEMRDDQRDHASKQEGPGGSWAPRAASTAAKMRSIGRAKKRQLGRLTSAVTYKATADGVVAVSRAPWSGVHQEGGTAGRGSKIPARPFLWISERLASKAIVVIERLILSSFGGA